MKTVLKSVRLPEGLVAKAEERAELYGLSFSDIVVDSLATGLATRRDPRVALLLEVGGLVFTMWPREFPPDVTRRVFLEIQNTPTLRALYDEAIAGDAGRPDEARRAEVNRQVGKLVRRVLGANVTGREQCPPGDELIRSYAVLKQLPY